MLIALALVLLAVAVVLTVVAVLGSGSVSLEVLNYDLSTTVLGVFLAGVVTGLLVVVGIAVLLSGVRRAKAQRREMRYLRRKVAQQDLAGEEPADAEPGHDEEPDRVRDSANGPAQAAKRR